MQAVLIIAIYKPHVQSMCDSSFIRRIAVVRIVKLVALEQEIGVDSVQMEGIGDEDGRDDEVGL